VTGAAKITYLTALVLGLAVGGFFGFQHATATLKAQYDSKQMAWTVLRDFSFMQYRHANPEHAKAALLALASLLEQMDKWIPQGTKRELVNAYARLSLVAEAENNPEQSRAYLARARYLNAAIGGRDFSDSEMKAAFKKFDDMEEHFQW